MFYGHLLSFELAKHENLDKFKEYNDTYGHVKGDECLKKVSSTIAHMLLRPYDQVYRFGGEEFVVLLPDTDNDGGIKVAESIRKNIEDMCIENKVIGKSDVVTVSIGVASTVPTEHIEKEILLGWSDEAMYEAKKNGRNRCCVYKGE
jgi:diguanylate cyclase (GGDEF)-like protein